MGDRRASVRIVHSHLSVSIIATEFGLCRRFRGASNLSGKASNKFRKPSRGGRLGFFDRPDTRDSSAKFVLSFGKKMNLVIFQRSIINL